MNAKTAKKLRRAARVDGQVNDAIYDHGKTLHRNLPPKERAKFLNMILDAAKNREQGTI